jgi:hypothetical protein
LSAGSGAPSRGSRGGKLYRGDLGSGTCPCCGVVACELATGEIHVFAAKAVIFATGGAGKIFKTTSNADTRTDGLGIFFRKGLPLEDYGVSTCHYVMGGIPRASRCTAATASA